MKYVDEYRDPDKGRRLLEEIRSRASRPWVLMEVCGGQTHSLLKHGIEEELKGVVELIHGPGCPVCVTAAQSIDFAQTLAMLPNTTLVTFGDMIRVPGTGQSLADVQATGGSVRTAYSPLDAVEFARQQPDEHFVFFAVGFETTAPATALAVLQADRLDLQNFSLLVNHVRVQPAMEAILNSPANRVQAFLAAGHVCAVTGSDSYHAMADLHQTPIVVTGFEPLDLLDGILACVTQLEAGTCEVENRYARAVACDGNTKSQQILKQVYRIEDSVWRGLGEIAGGGLALLPKWQQFDAAKCFAAIQPNSHSLPVIDPEGECRAADVLSGNLRPDRCPAFAKRCQPNSPLGAPMVSSEGACAAYFRFDRRPATQHAATTNR